LFTFFFFLLFLHFLNSHLLPFAESDGGCEVGNMPKLSGNKLSGPIVVIYVINIYFSVI
jgi:hypothetical protein